MPKLPSICSAKELSKASFWLDVCAEVVCSMYLVMPVTFVMVTFNSGVYNLSITHVGIMVGFNIYLLIEGFGPICGAHMNPVVSWAFLISGRITFLRALFYTIAQCLGGVVGSSFAYGLCPDSMRSSFFAFVPGPGLGPERAMVVELLYTCLLVFTCLSTTSDNLRTVMLPSLPTAFTVGVGIMAVGTWTGGCFNPIISLGPAVVSKNFTHIWVYWVGPYLGATMATLLLKVFLMTRDKPTSTASDENKKPEDEKQIMLKDEISSLVEKVMSLAVEHHNNSNSLQIMKSKSGSQHNITSSSGV